MRVVVADPDGSVYSGGEGRPYFVEGVGEDIWVPNYDPSIPDEKHAVTDAESFSMCRRLATEEGLLVGGSSGLAVTAALRWPGSGPRRRRRRSLARLRRGYLAKIFNDQWMIDHGFGEVVSTSTGTEISVKSTEEISAAVRDGEIASGAQHRQPAKLDLITRPLQPTSYGPNGTCSPMRSRRSSQSPATPHFVKR